MIARVYTRKRKGPDGKTVRMYGVRYPWGGRDIRQLCGDSKKAAEAIASDITHLSQTGMFKGPEHSRLIQEGDDLQTFAQLCERFWETHRKNVRPATQDKYERILRDARIHFGEKWNAETKQFTGNSDSVLVLSRSKVEAYIEGLQTDGGSPVTRNRALTLLRKMFEKAADWDAIEKNPTKGIDKIKEPERTRTVSPEEHAAILAQAPAWLAPVLEAGFHTGARLGDLLGDQYGKAPLQWADLHLDDDDPYVLFLAERTKEKADRKVPLNSVLTSMFKGMRKARFGDLAARTGTATGPVFVRVLSKKRPTHVEAVNAGSISKALRTAVTAAKVTEGESITFHCYRRSFCTQIANSKSVTLKQSMALAGHRTAVTHLKYQHPDDAGKAEAVEFLANLAPGRHRETTQKA